jgi:predicted nucleic acid-binding protein
VRVFFDTKVILDVVLRREPQAAESAKVWALAETARIRGLVSAVSITNLFYVARKHSSKGGALEAVRTVGRIFDLVACDAGVIGKAVEASFGDFEDAVQYYCAEGAGADCIVTRNPKDFPKAGIPVLTPEAVLAMVV